MKLGNLIQARKTLMPYIGEKVSAKLAYKMMKLIKSTLDEVDFYDNKVKEVIMKYAEKDDNGEIINDNGNIKLIKDTANDCQEEINDIANIDIDKPQVMFLLRELDELKLSATEMFALDEFIKIEEE